MLRREGQWGSAVFHAIKIDAAEHTITAAPHGARAHAANSLAAQRELHVDNRASCKGMHSVLALRPGRSYFVAPWLAPGMTVPSGITCVASSPCCSPDMTPPSGITCCAPPCCVCSLPEVVIPPLVVGPSARAGDVE
jgi:hypothetical protein